MKRKVNAHETPIYREVAFNLTENQSTDSERFNENCFWVNGILQVLPPVKFIFTFSVNYSK